MPALRARQQRSPAMRNALSRRSLLQSVIFNLLRRYERLPHLQSMQKLQLRSS
jgi:hypothetical protein